MLGFGGVEVLTLVFLKLVVLLLLSVACVGMVELAVVVDCPVDVATPRSCWD